MIDDAGVIASSRHVVKRPSNVQTACALVRVDRMDFAKPMKIGQLAMVEAMPTFASPSSVEIKVNVWAEDLHSGVVQKTNQASLWYVRVEDCARPQNKMGWSPNDAIPPKLKVVKDIPPLEFESQREAHEALARYNRQKESRRGSLEAAKQNRSPNVLAVLSHMVLPSDCYGNGTVFGGTLMKLIDNAAACTAISYCKTTAVTVSMDALNFEAPIFLGNIARFYAHVTFTSSRSVEVTVHVEAEDLMRLVFFRRFFFHVACAPGQILTRSVFQCGNSGQSWRAVSAHLTFVSLDGNGKSLPVKPLEPRTHEERMDFQAGMVSFDSFFGKQLESRFDKCSFLL